MFESELHFSSKSIHNCIVEYENTTTVFTLKVLFNKFKAIYMNTYVYVLQDLAYDQAILKNTWEKL